MLEITDGILAPHLKSDVFNQKLKMKANGIGEKRSYRLFSVVNHKGGQMNKGHYVCSTLDSNNDWISYDD